jgi:hypothetical protein
MGVVDGVGAEGRASVGIVPEENSEDENAIVFRCSKVCCWAAA